jgi:DNA-binding NarL/FixJ family response regulator
MDTEAQDGFQPGEPMKDPDKISVVLVEDDRHYRAYVASVLADAGRFAVVAEAASAEEAARWGAELAPRVALVDVVLPGARGTVAVPRLLERFPQLLVIMLTARTDDEVILEAIRAGAAGYVLKGAASQEILDAVDGALAGGAPMSPAIARRVLGLMRAAPSGATQAVAAKTGMGGELRALTERETDVLGLVAAGATDKEAAAKLGVSVSAIKAHLANIYAKWRVRSRTEAAIKFTQAGG